MASNVPQAQATEEAQGSQEASVDCVAFFSTDWWNNAHLSLAFVHGGSTQHSSTQLWKCLHRAIEQKKNSQLGLRSLMSRRLYFSLSPKISISNQIHDPIRDPANDLIWSDPDFVDTVI